MTRLVNLPADFESVGPETWELLAAIAKRIGVRRIARATGRHERTIYFWIHDPLTSEGAEGHTNVLDWFEALATEAASSPRSRAEALQLENWTVRLFGRLLRNDEPEPICNTELLKRAALAAREHGEAMSEVLNLEGDDDVALREALEARHALDGIILGLQSRGS